MERREVITLLGAFGAALPALVARGQVPHKAGIDRRSRRGLEGSYTTESQWISAGNAGTRLRQRPELHH